VLTRGLVVCSFETFWRGFLTRNFRSLYSLHECKSHTRHSELSGTVWRQSLWQTGPSALQQLSHTTHQHLKSSSCTLLLASLTMFCEETF